MIDINYLSWDTDVFGFKVGLLNDCLENKDVDFDKVISKAKEEDYSLLYYKNPAISDVLQSKGIKPVDEKVTYKKVIDSHDVNESWPISSVLHQPLQNDLLLLALQSGAHSRYYLDKKMPIHVYLSLYTAWIKNSLDGSIATDVLAYQVDGRNVGLITYKYTDNVVTIGLLVVDYSSADNGIGSKLIRQLCSLFPEGTVIEVATQKKNTGACRFYEKNGFKVDSVQDIYHIWVDEYCKLTK